MPLSSGRPPPGSAVACVRPVRHRPARVEGAAVGTETRCREEEHNAGEGDENHDHRHRPRRPLALLVRLMARSERCRSAALTITVWRSCATAAAIAGCNISTPPLRTLAPTRTLAHSRQAHEWRD